MSTSLQSGNSPRGNSVSATCLQYIHFESIKYSTRPLKTGLLCSSFQTLEALLTTLCLCSPPETHRYSVWKILHTPPLTTGLLFSSLEVDIVQEQSVVCLIHRKGGRSRLSKSKFFSANLNKRSSYNAHDHRHVRHVPDLTVIWTTSPLVQCVDSQMYSGSFLLFFSLFSLFFSLY